MSCDYAEPFFSVARGCVGTQMWLRNMEEYKTYEC